MKNLDWHIKALLIISVPFILYAIALSVLFPLYQLLIQHTNMLTYDLYAYLKGIERLFANNMTLYNTPKEIGWMWYLYPPPGILFFIPLYFIPFPVNYFTYKIIIIILYISAIRLLFKTREGFPDKPGKGLAFALLVILLGINPIQRDVQFMNANTLFTFMAVLSFYFQQKKKYLLSLLSLFAGFWIKLYPIVLLSTYLKEKKLWRIALLAVCSALIFVVLFLPLLPWNLYTYYFLDYMPKFINFPQASSPMNQSLMNFIHHFFLPKEALMWWHNIEIPGNIRAFNMIFSVVGFVGLAVYYVVRGERVKFYVFASMLALTGVVSITGWDFVYVCAMPLLLFSLIISIGNANWVRSIVGFSVLLFFMPKPTTSFITFFNDKIPFFLQNLFYFRMPVIVIALTILNLYLIEKGLWGKYGSFLRNDARDTAVASSEKA